MLSNVCYNNTIINKHDRSSAGLEQRISNPWVGGSNPSGRTNLIMKNTCKHCQNSFDVLDKPKGWMANHSRWCDKNPKRLEYINNTSVMRSGITKASVEKRNKGIKDAHKDGKYSGSSAKGVNTRIERGNLNHTQETKELLRQKALASPHRRLVRNIINYKGIMLDSSWELALAKRLDDKNIKWIRPSAIPWIDKNGITHNYFPDFYLPEHNLLLDPKNPYAIKVQKDKLDIILTQLPNLRILSTLQQCEEFSI